LTIDDLSGSSTPGTLVLSTPSPYFYGDIIIGNTGAPTVVVDSDAALGNTTGSADEIGEVELNGGTLQTGESFSAPERNIVLDGGSQIGLAGNTTSWGSLTDVKRTIAIVNSSATAGSISFSSFTISQTSTLQLDGSAAGVTYNGAETVTFTNGILQSAPTDTLFIDPSSVALGVVGGEVFSSGPSTTLINGMAPAWIISNSGGSASTNPYNFVTYSNTNGYANLTYSDSGSGSSGGIRTATSTSTVDQIGNATLSANAAAYALKINDGDVITATGHTITLGDGTDPAGLIVDGGSAGITGGTLAFGGSEAIIYAAGSDAISAAITGSNGLVLAGSGTLTLGSASPGLSGPITIDSGELSLTAINAFFGDVGGLTLGDVKSNPAKSTLNFTANQTFTTLDSVGTNSAITFSNGSALTIGDANNLNSTLSSSITETGTTTSGAALVKNGTGLLDLSGMSSGKLNLAAGSEILVNSGDLRVTASIFANANFTVQLGSGTQLQFEEGGGDAQFANAVTGSGELHLIGGTLQLTGINNTYSGGTVVETGSTLDTTTANLPTINENITDAGGLIVFDQDNGGIFTGVISDGQELGTGPTESGSLDIDDSAADNASFTDVTLSQDQTYTGATYVEAGTLTLGAVNAIVDSSGLTLGRVGGAVDSQTANLVLEANNQLNSLNSDASNTTSVVLNGHILVLDPSVGTPSSFSGTISDGMGGAGSIVVDGTGSVTLGGSNSFRNPRTGSGGRRRHRADYPGRRSGARHRCRGLACRRHSHHPD
jgi:fibronectin-binding autotransporter adhesin